MRSNNKSCKHVHTRWMTYMYLSLYVLYLDRAWKLCLSLHTHILADEMGIVDVDSLDQVEGHHPHLLVDSNHGCSF